MPVYSWGKTRPSQQEQRVSDAERRLGKMLVEIEATYSQQRSVYERRKEDVARQRAQLMAYYEAADARKRGSGDSPAARLPGRIDFILAGIRAEMTIEGVVEAFPSIDEVVTLQLGATLNRRLRRTISMPRTPRVMTRFTPPVWRSRW